MSEKPVLVLGTHNRKKGIELRELLEPHGIRVQTLAEIPESIEVEEDRETFEGNARKKASEQAQHLQRWVLAEDSGLAVDALDGAPGVYSARYSGPEATDEKNNQKLLQELGETPLEQRTAYYVCYAALSDPLGNILATSEGRCHGRILFDHRGTNGFGYDPLFEVVEHGQTFGELSSQIKQQLSHRGQAMREMLPQIVAVLST